MKTLMLLLSATCATVLGITAPRSLKKARYVQPAASDSENGIFPIPHSYMVSFHPNHTVDDHFVNIGFNLSALIGNNGPVLYFEPFRFTPGYYAIIVNSTLVHDAIRHDSGVQSVTLDFGSGVELQKSGSSDSSYDAFGAGNTTSTKAGANILSKLGQSLKKRQTKKWTWLHRPHTDWWIADTSRAKARPSTLAQGGDGVLVYVVDSAVDPSKWPSDKNDPLWYMHAQTLDDLSPYCQVINANNFHVLPFTEIYGAGDNSAGSAAGAIIGDKHIGFAPDVTIKSVKVLCSFFQYRNHPGWPHYLQVFSPRQPFATARSVYRALEDILQELTDLRREFSQTPDEQKPLAYYGVIVLIGVTSLGWPWWDIFDILLRKMKAAGVFVVAGAGNNGINVRAGREKLHFPSQYADAGVFIVGAYDQLAIPPGLSLFSNRGPAVSIWAPGNNIIHGISSTSMAAAQVAGWAATIMSFEEEALGYPMNVDMLINIIKDNSIPNGVYDEWPGTIHMKGLKFDTGFTNDGNQRAPYKSSLKYPETTSRE